MEEAKLIGHDWVKGKLFSRIDGYEHPETKFFMYKGIIYREETTKIYPPDVDAMRLYAMIEGLIVHKTENNNNNLNTDVERVIYELPHNGRRKDVKPTPAPLTDPTNDSKDI
jgi:hypothetical protein